MKTLQRVERSPSNRLKAPYKYLFGTSMEKYNNIHLLIVQVYIVSIYGPQGIFQPPLLHRATSL